MQAVSNATIKLHPIRVSVCIVKFNICSVVSEKPTIMCDRHAPKLDVYSVQSTIYSLITLIMNEALLILAISKTKQKALFTVIFFRCSLLHFRCCPFCVKQVVHGCVHFLDIRLYSLFQLTFCQRLIFFKLQPRCIHKHTFCCCFYPNIIIN